jgi:hypothetical protein
MLAMKRATTARPSYSSGIGGIERKTSSVSSATIASRSAASYARTNFATMASSDAESGRRLAVRECLPSLLQARSRPFESAVDGIHSRVQHVGDLARAESENVAQDEDGQLARRQNLKGFHKRQRDGFGLLVASVRSERHIDGTAKKGVGKWLEPHNLAESRRLEPFHAGHVPLLGGSSAAPSDAH